jgi:hypothetical protein
VVRRRIKHKRTRPTCTPLPPSNGHGCLYGRSKDSSRTWAGCRAFWNSRWRDHVGSRGVRATRNHRANVAQPPDFFSFAWGTEQQGTLRRDDLEEKLTTRAGVRSFGIMKLRLFVRGHDGRRHKARCAGMFIGSRKVELERINDLREVNYTTALRILEISQFDLREVLNGLRTYHMICAINKSGTREHKPSLPPSTTL